MSVLVLSFGLLILSGCLVLMLPEASKGPALSLIDALFTATSAVCVTGLSVIDIGSDFSLLGQITVMVLIQLGGLGIMTFSTLILLLLGRRLSFRTHNIINQSQPGNQIFSLGRTLINVIIYTFSIEALGFILLTLGFKDYLPLEKALWWAGFHSVSAFCNAGFSLSASSLTMFQTDWFLNFSFMGLIILGGLGFVVMAELATLAGQPGRFFKKKNRRPLSLHTKIVLATTTILILAGTAYIFTMESIDSMAGYHWPDRLLISLFQSVTARTAGFNTVDMSQLSNATVFILIGLMFFGASPGSCGGGVKTTTLATLAAMVRARLKGETRERLFGRSLPKEAVNRSLVLVLSSILVVGFFITLLFSFMPETTDRGQFVALVFEAFSAFGTVGLSLGATESLDSAAKLVIAALMFIGRLGPLTMVRFLTTEPKAEDYRFAEENYLVG